MRWTTPSTAPDPDDRHRRVLVTPRFHPLSGRDFEFVAHRQNWGEDRVHLHNENGVLFSLPAGWTDVAARPAAPPGDPNESPPFGHPAGLQPGAARLCGHDGPDHDGARLG